MGHLLDIIYVSGSKKGKVGGKMNRKTMSELSKFFKINNYQIKPHGLTGARKKFEAN